MQILKDLFSLENKTALITGAAEGLGRQFALTLAEVGANLILLDRQQKALETVADKARSFGHTVEILCLDLIHSQDIQETMEKVRQEHAPIDILVNNAAVGGANPIESTTFHQALQHYQEYSEINFRAPWLLSHMVAQQMMQHKIAGSIINIASACGDRSPGKFNAIYSATKAALIQMTRSMALELASKKIRVNAILPGLINTPMAQDMINSKNFDFEDVIPLGFIALPEDLKATLLLLASNKASAYITGSLITIDGGASISSLFRK